ncbi:MAG TPA: hypothetical protein VFO60_07240 [Candidatus Dormibacteraeota bacterium]|nr:hypothetical protein [Candidatus Dormibacteraeota bacterium]
MIASGHIGLTGGTVMSFLRSRRGTVETAPPAPRGWVGRAYGAGADALVDGLPARMQAAALESEQPSTASWATDTPERPQWQRELLRDDLKSLRAALLVVNVAVEDVDRDRRLRAALSTAIGAADALALASRSQPTAAYLGVTRAAVDGVLIATGRRALG